MPSTDSIAAGSAVMIRKAKSKSFASMASKMDGGRSCVGKSSIGGLRSNEPVLAASNRKPQ